MRMQHIPFSETEVFTTVINPLRGYSLRRAFVLFFVIPTVLVSGAYAFAQVFLVPSIAEGESVALISKTETNVFYAKLGLMRNARMLGEINDSRMSVPGTIIGFNRDNIQVYEYPSAQAAKMGAQALKHRAPWLLRTQYFHAYVKGNLVVLYFGSHTDILHDLAEFLGPEYPINR